MLYTRLVQLIDVARVKGSMRRCRKDYPVAGIQPFQRHPPSAVESIEQPWTGTGLLAPPQAAGDEHRTTAIKALQVDPIRLPGQCPVTRRTMPVVSFPRLEAVSHAKANVQVRSILCQTRTKRRLYPCIWKNPLDKRYPNGNGFHLRLRNRASID